MVTIDATAANSDIKKLWETAASEPVTVQSDGKPIAVVLSPDEYDRLNGHDKPRELGFGRGLFAGVDIDELLSTPIDDVFEEYMQ